METPRIRQRYKCKSYDVTYGDLGDLDKEYTPEPQYRVMRRPRLSGDPPEDKSCKPVKKAVKVAWLLTSKQMLLEGLTEFHQRSVWLFKMSIRKSARAEYVFSLITPALVSEQHLLVKNDDYGMPFAKHKHEETKGQETITWNVFTPCASTMELVNVMTTAAESRSERQSMRMRVNIPAFAFCDRTSYHRWNRDFAYFKNVVWDLSKFDRLAVH